MAQRIMQDMAKKKKTRVELRKNRAKPPRDKGWTSGFQKHGFEEDATVGGERVRAKGELSRTGRGRSDPCARTCAACPWPEQRGAD
jgi:hypothetical protein